MPSESVMYFGVNYGGMEYINPAPKSPRAIFQWKYFVQALQEHGKGSVLNVGCSNDPLGFSDLVMHFDYDDWSFYLPDGHFTQGDAHRLTSYFGEKSFPVVIMGDIVEHLVSPIAALQECAHVASQWLVVTVFKEWRLSQPGQHIKEAQRQADEENVAQGYESVEHYQQINYPKKISGGDLPHQNHINQLVEADMFDHIRAVEDVGLELVEYTLKSEPVPHDDHALENWLLSFRRKESQNGS